MEPLSDLTDLEAVPQRELGSDKLAALPVPRARAVAAEARHDVLGNIQPRHERPGSGGDSTRVRWPIPRNHSQGYQPRFICL